MSKIVKKHLAIMLTLAVIVSGINSSSLYAIEDSTICDMTTYSEETTGLPDSITDETSEEYTSELITTQEQHTSTEESSTESETSDKSVTAPKKSRTSAAVDSVNVRAIRYEAEDTQLPSERTIVQNSAYSGGKAVGNMNIWPDNGRIYLTKVLSVDRAGNYKLTIAYASDSEDAEKRDTNIDIRVNSEENSDWKSLRAPLTGGEDKVKTISTIIALEEGTNVIEITGASNVWYGEPHSWQWANIDYFEIADAPMAEGKHEAENAASFTKGSSATEHTIVEYEEYSGGKAVGEMNIWPNDGRAYLTYPVNVEKPGEYTLTIAYSADSDDTQKRDTNIDIRVNETGEWKSLNAPLR